MNRASIEFPEKDRALREDVGILATLVGDMLREQRGDEFFAAIEALRKTAIERRNHGDPEIDAKLAAMARNLDPDIAKDMVRAFATYFQMVNLAEKIHRIRRRRQYLRAGAEPQVRSLEHTFRELSASGCDWQHAEQLLATLSVEPVFTAHPTEATRRSMLEKQQRIARLLVERMHPELTPHDYEVQLARIRAELTSGWQTEEHPNARLTVQDERENLLFFITDVIYRVIPVFYETLESGFQQVYGRAPTRVPDLIRFASWVGGDMDGNPNVSSRTVRDTLGVHRRLIIHNYRADLSQLARQLSQSEHRVEVDPRLRRRVEQYGIAFPEIAEPVHARHRDMLYRRFLRQMSGRLLACVNGEPGAYANAAQFLDDLQLIHDSLKANRGEHAGLFPVLRLIRRARTFGFHLATLDVRQDALVHRSLIGRALGVPDWDSWSAAERTDRLLEALRQAGVSEAPDSELDATLDVFRAIDEAQQHFGPGAIGPYIISMAQGVDDVLSVLLLALWAGLGDDDGAVSLDVAPLFETVDDLDAGPGVLTALCEEPYYRAHLARRGDRQMVMIGYSDSNKDGGMAAARWAQYKGQDALTVAARDSGIGLTLFHGRGGTVSRGGGKTHEAVLAAPPGSVAGRLRLTEQGEIINAKYGLRGIAIRTLEQAIAGTAIATAGCGPARPVAPEWRGAMDIMASASRSTYRQLVFETPEFLPYFRNATPIDVIERMQIGSRPASRRKGGGIENLRAIPWVFSWTQSRQTLPGWFGLGTGLQQAADHGGEDLLREMASSWPCLQTLLEDAEMVLAKSDLEIGHKYAQLAPASCRHIFELISAEFALTLRWVLRLRDSETLLEREPGLRRAILLRNPYVDPMSLMQVDLLRRWRADDRSDPAIFDALLATVNGIAQGLQNTG